MHKIFFVLLIFVSPIFALKGSVNFSNGECINGNISLNRELSFRDIFLQKSVSIPIEQVYCMEMLLEGLAEYQTFNQKYPHSLERRFLLAVHTWTGKSYWGKLHINITVRLPNGKKNSYTLPKTQVIWDKNNKNLAYIRSIFFNPTSSRQFTPSLLFLSGEVRPIHRFRAICALHHHSGIMFHATVENGKDYYFPRIMPGLYSLFLIGTNEIVFGLVLPARKHPLDKTTDSESDRLGIWVRKTSQTYTQREVVYFAGRYSQTYSIVLEKELTPPTSVENLNRPIQNINYYLWTCYRRGENWQMKHNYTLGQYSHPINILYDVRLEAIFIPHHTSQSWNYHP